MRNGEGRVICNPVTGERIVIRTSAAESDGRILCFDLFLPPGGHVPARHAHPEQVERFTVIDGQVRFRIGRRTVLAVPGTTVEVPKGTPHWFGNAGQHVARVHVEVEPALRMEELFEATESMARLGHRPGLFELASFLLEFRREVAVPTVPAALVRTVLEPLVWFWRRRRADLGPS